MAKQRHSVLVVDDDQVVRTVLINILKREGYRVVEATNGKEALAIIKQNVPDFVITDLVMPEMGGLDLLIEIKNDYPDVRVAVITGHPGSFTPEEIIANGADHYILKPFHANQINQALRDMAEAVCVI